MNSLWPFLASAAFEAVRAYNPEAVLCPLNEYIDDEDQTVREFFECPGPEDPQDYKVCCEDRCCQLKHVDSILGLDLKLAMMISLCVIVLCVISGIMLIICCFAHPCPLYDTCSGSWGKDEKMTPGMILALPPNNAYTPEPDSPAAPPPIEAQQLLATKDQNGKVNHVIINGESNHEPV